MRNIDMDNINDDANRVEEAMSYLVAAPDMLVAAAADVAGVGSSLSEANAVAAAPTSRPQGRGSRCR